MPARKTVLNPPPESPPQPTRAASTSARAHNMSSATRSSTANTPGQVVPALNSDFAITCSCSAAQSLYAATPAAESSVSSFIVPRISGSTSASRTLRLPNA